MSDFKIADGYDGTPESLDALSPPLFNEYVGKEVVFTVWHPYLTRERAGDRSMVAVGLPWIEAVFFRLTRAEYEYLLTNFGDEVTILTLNKDTNVYTEYNARMVKPDTSDVDWDRDTGQGFDNVKFEFEDLEAT